MKRILSSFLAIVLILTPCCNVAHAVETNTASARESPTLAYYFIQLVTGNNSGQIGLVFDVAASVASADRIGIERIKVYDAETGLAATLQGYTTNGLIGTNTYIHGGTYWYTLSPNRPYYAEVTVFATAGSVYDSRVVTTNLVVSPS